MKRPNRLVVAAACVSVVAAGGAYVHFFAYGPTSFDRAVWRAGEGDDVPFSQDAPRLRMADGLVDSGILVGKDQHEIDDLLGPPTDTSKFRSYDRVYWLGAERGLLGMDSEWLVLRFRDGEVAEVRIVRD